MLIHLKKQVTFRLVSPSTFSLEAHTVDGVQQHWTQKSYY
jgi:hypothetical protein